jgi:exopolyphosphatase/guanosine-5'-triphosphate,3'-diphosphate pyrophosphatase
VLRACIDIGSNTTRLLVAECGGSGLVERHQERSFTRIGRALGADGAIEASKLAEVEEVVHQQLLSAQRAGAVEVRCVATASVRRAVNADELVARVARRDGLAVEILSAQDEARLAFLGASRMLEHDPGGPLGVVDVGGGSSEMIVGTVAGGVEWWASFPLGSSDVATACLASDPPSADEFAAARDRVADALAGTRPPPTSIAVAVGGSATSLLRLVGSVLDAETFRRSLELFAAERASDLAERFALDAERVRLLPAGLLILEAVSQLFERPLQVGRGGLREGVLLDGAPA